MITCCALIQDKLKFSLVHVEHAASNEDLIICNTP